MEEDTRTGYQWLVPVGVRPQRGSRVQLLGIVCRGPRWFGPMNPQVGKVGLAVMRAAHLSCVCRHSKSIVVCLSAQVHPRTHQRKGFLRGSRMPIPGNGKWYLSHLICNWLQARSRHWQAAVGAVLWLQNIPLRISARCNSGKRIQTLPVLFSKCMALTLLIRMLGGK